MDRITRRAITIKTFQTSDEARVITLIALGQTIMT